MTNIAADQVNQARSIIEQAKDLLIALPQKPSLDCVASSLSLYLALSSQGKNVSIVCPDQMTVEFNRLIGVDKVSQSISGGAGNNLVISFPYQEGSIEKVSYNIENETFNLVIEPREGYPIITPEMMQYSYSGGNTDAIICIGAHALNNLNSLFSNNQGLFADKPIINIDNNPQNQRYGKASIIDQNSSSIAEIIVSLFSMLGLTMDVDIASNLYSGISSGSQNFTSSLTNAATFEAAAICLRHGAKKTEEKAPSYNQNQPLSAPPAQFNQSSKPQPAKPSFPNQRTPSSFQSKPPFQQSRSSNQQPSMKPQYQQPIQNRQPQAQSQPTHQTQPQSKQNDDAPPDWLKPKIYKGSTLL